MNQRIKVLSRIVDDLKAHSYTEEQIAEEIRLRFNNRVDMPSIPEQATLEVKPADHVIFEYSWEG